METETETKPKRGFATIDPARRRELASMGGKAAHAKGTGHQFTSEEAKKAGSKGGRASGRAFQENKHKAIDSSSTYDVSWARKSMMLVTGAQGSGKTMFTDRLLEGRDHIRIFGDTTREIIRANHGSVARLGCYAVIVEVNHQNLAASLAELREFLAASPVEIVIIETNDFMPPAAFDVVIKCVESNPPTPHKWVVTRSRVQREHPNGDIFFTKK